MSEMEKNLSGRLWLGGMGLFLALAGAVFTGVLWTAWQRAEETRRWTALPCQITISALHQTRPTQHSNLVYRPQLAYRYRFQEREYVGTQLKRVDVPSQHQEVVKQRIQAFPVGKQTTCYVNPQQPAQAVLLHDSRAALYSIWFPLLFVVGGLGMLRAAVWKSN
jgi:hypothetical protein